MAKRETDLDYLIFLKEMDEKKLSKFLSLVLRHKPEEIGIELDKNGWTDVKTLLLKLNQNGMKVNMELLRSVVANNDKQRFAFDQYQTKIRANQGHSTADVEIEFDQKTPPAILFHGTSVKYISDIIKSPGLNKMKRHYVHLSANVETAEKVGARHGKPVIIEVNSGQMHIDGYIFYQSANGVWLVDSVPKKYFFNINYLE